MPLHRSMSASLILSTKIGRTGVIKLNRSKVLNAFNFEMASNFADQLNILNNDHSVSTIVIAGSKKAFSSSMRYFSWCRCEMFQGNHEK